MYDNEFCFAVRECLLFVKDSFSTTPESVVTTHLLHVCLLMVGGKGWLCVVWVSVTLVYAHQLKNYFL